MRSTQSETTVGAHGRNIVAAYNTSAGMQFRFVAPATVVLDRLLLSGYSHSGDGGKTWTSGFLPPLPDSRFTFGDPVLDMDRHGNFYFSGLGADALGRFTIQVNKSSDGGRTWGPAVLVQQDNGGDKEWLAVGPDPVVKSRDNVYVTWTSFQPTGAELRFARSTDGGATFTARTVFAPATQPNPAMPQNSLQFTAPYVDRITGRLYIPFVHFSFSDVDFIRVLVSDDAGETFRFLDFNAPGAPLASVLPIVAVGTATECGVLRITNPPLLIPNVRLTVHSGPNLGGSLTGLPRYANATRQLSQPALAARNGVVYLAWPNSTSSSWGDPASRSNVLFIRSDDAGATWTAPVQVNPVGPGQRHFMASVAIGDSPNSVHVGYYTQLPAGTITMDVANSHDRGASFPINRTVRLNAVPFNLVPSNVPIPSALNPWATTNYDSGIASCYDVGEYIGVASRNGSVYVVWADNRNLVTEPVHPLNPLSGVTHPQQDVFFQELKAQ
jgi:hypothetical protein